MKALGMGLEDVKGRVGGTDYRVDAGAVAEAMLRRPGILRLLTAATARGARTPAPPVPRRHGV
jgi:hypothetical protein